MLLSVLAAAGLPPDAAGLRGDIADAIDAMDQPARQAFMTDVVDPVAEIASPDTVLGPTFCNTFGADHDWTAWSTAVRTGSDMLGAAELHVLRGLMQRAGVRLEATSVASLDNAGIRGWALKQAEAGPVVLIATDGTHYNWVDFRDHALKSGGSSGAATQRTRRGCASKACVPRAAPVIRKRRNATCYADYIVPACAFAAVVFMAAFTGTASRGR